MANLLVLMAALMKREVFLETVQRDELVHMKPDGSADAPSSHFIFWARSFISFLYFIFWAMSCMRYFISFFVESAPARISSRILCFAAASLSETMSELPTHSEHREKEGGGGEGFVEERMRGQTWKEEKEE